MLNFYLNVLKEHYADFNGRTRRKDYWTFTLINAGIVIVAYILALILAFISATLFGILSAIIGLYSLAVLVPSLAISVRRLHDTGKPTWMVIFGFLPIISFYFLYLMILEGDRGDNEFGPDPKA